jgi:hypothetical protein
MIIARRLPLNGEDIYSPLRDNPTQDKVSSPVNIKPGGFREPPD